MTTLPIAIIPLSQTAALKTIEILIRDNIPENAKKIGELLTKGF